MTSRETRGKVAGHSADYMTSEIGTYTNNNINNNNHDV